MNGSRLLLFAALAATAAVLASGCGGTGDKPASAASAHASSCPAKWRPGWQKLANRVGFPVYCPGWMPNPLTAQIGGPWDNGVSVSKDGSYLVSFLWHETGSGDVHVNLRGYPNRRAIPTCSDRERVGKRIVVRRIPCFSDPRQKRRVGGIAATLYTVNQGADQWHLLYLWRRGGSLFTLSEHVIIPLTYRKVLRNLNRTLESLTLVSPGR